MRTGQGAVVIGFCDRFTVERGWDPTGSPDRKSPTSRIARDVGTLIFWSANLRRVSILCGEDVHQPPIIGDPTSWQMSWTFVVCHELRRTHPCREHCWRSQGASRPPALLE